MSNSPLVSYTKISPNRYSPRNHAIDTITIHCVVGQVTVQQLGSTFGTKTRKASSNYGIGKDGKVGMYVEEKDASWCSSSKSNDMRAVTIEVASDVTHPYAVTSAAYESLIKLVADICKRNNIKRLYWEGNKALIGNIKRQNMTVHRWFASKACPGNYLYNKQSDFYIDKTEFTAGNSEFLNDEQKENIQKIERMNSETNILIISKNFHIARLIS